MRLHCTFFFKMTHKYINTPKPQRFCLLFQEHMDKQTHSFHPPNSYFAGEPHQSAYRCLSVGDLKFCSLPYFADLHSVLEKREPLQQQTSDRKK